MQPEYGEIIPENVLISIMNLSGNHYGFRLVSKKWKKIYDENIGLEFGCYMESFRELSTLPPCRKMEIVDDGYTCTIPPLESKHLLKKLCIDCEIYEEDLSRTFTGLTNLRKLTIGSEGILGINCGVYMHDFINLKVLKLSWFGVIRTWSLNKDPGQIGLITLLTIGNFPVLEKLEILLRGVVQLRENILIDALLKFFTQHQNSIQKFFLQTEGRLGKRNVENEGEDWESVPNYENRVQKLALEKLQRLIVVFDSNCLVKISELISRMLEKVKNLEIYDQMTVIRSKNMDSKCYDLILKPIPHTFLTKNVNTLRKLGLNIEPSDCCPLDCSIFTQFLTLVQLRLMSQENSNAEMINVHKLPEDLEKLQIRNILLKSEEVKYISKNFPELEYIYFGNIGNENGYGATLQSYSYFRRKLSQIHIINSWNSADTLECYTSKIPELRISAIALLETTKVKMGREGLMKTKRPSPSKRMPTVTLVTLPVKFKDIACAYDPDSDDVNNKYVDFEKIGNNAFDL